MVDNQQLILIIDGNNLAHFLYTNLSPDQKMTGDMVEKLIQHLTNYARMVSGKVSVELILDRMPKLILSDQISPLRVFAAEYPQDGDNLLLERFWFHHVSLHPCLVITNDDEIIEEVKGEKGNVMLVYDFVRRPGSSNPVFREPDDLPNIQMPVMEDRRARHPLSLRTSIFFRIAEDQGRQTIPIQMGNPLKPIVKPEPRIEYQVPSLNPAEFDLDTPSYNIIDKDADEYEKPAALADHLRIQEPFFELTMDSWPVREGVRFLRGAFCDAHRKEFSDLLGSVDYQNLQYEDLKAVAELLLHACQEDENFCRRGSLMDRVRLALLTSKGDPLSLTELVERTGLPKNGLFQKIKAKGGKWVRYQPGKISL